MQTSIVTYNKVKNNSKDFRIDAEFYLPVYLQYEKLIDGQTNDLLRNLADSSYKAFRRKDGVFEYIEISNVDLTTGEYYSEVLNSDNPPSRAKKILHKNDVIISTVRPNRNAVSIIFDEKKDLVASTGFCKLTAKRINPKFLFVLFKTSVYRDLLVRFTTATMYPAVNEDDILNLKIPIFDDKFQTQIELIVNQSYSLINKSKYFYFNAEQILLSELGLLNWKPKHRLSFIREFSDTLASGRIDAEYFQPMYEEISERFQEYFKTENMENITKLIGHPSNPPYVSEDSKNKTFIITQKHLGNYFPSDNFWEDSEALYTSDDFVKQNKRYLLQANDIILYSVGAYIGKANIYNSKVKATIGSFLTLIRPEPGKVNPYYLLVFLNSEIGKEMTRRCSRGMAQQYVYPYDIKKFRIPIISEIKQIEIEKRMLESLDAKVLSKRLLDIAKRGVEMAIEKSEKEAIKWIEAETNSLGVKLEK